MLSLNLVVLCVVALVRLTNGLPYGVPASACKDMMPKGPGHNDLPAQNSEPPFIFSVEPDNIDNNGKVEFSISQKPGGPKLGGFMVQARIDKTSDPIGTFQAKGDDAGTVTCSNENDTGSHTNPNPKEKVTLFWTPPPDFKGKANFYATVTEGRLKFWVFKEAGSVIVKHII